MKTRARLKRFWWTIVGIATLAMIYLVVPPLVPLDKFSNQFANAISHQLDEDVHIYGKIRLSLLGYPMMSVENLRVGDARIKQARFRISWRGVFNMSSAEIVGSVRLSGLEMQADNLAVPRFQNRIIVHNSRVSFAGRNYEIVDAVFDGDRITANVRTLKHRYHIDFSHGNFIVTNPNENLNVTGRLIKRGDGIVGATGSLSIYTDNVNKFFLFRYPVIREKTRLSLDFNWNGDGEFDFSNIQGSAGRMNFDGRVHAWFGEDGIERKRVRMNVTNADLDLSFLEDNERWLGNSDFNINIAGRIRTPWERFKKLSRLQLRSTTAESGEIDIQMLRVDGAEWSMNAVGKLAGRSVGDMDVTLTNHKRRQTARCALSGSVYNWRCDRFQFVSDEFSARGNISVTPEKFRLTFNSENLEPELSSLAWLEDRAGGRRGDIEFKISSMEGRASIRPGNRRIEYVQTNTRLSSLPVNVPMPVAMLNVRGNIAALISDDKVSFSFTAPEWSLSVDDTDRFVLNHNDARTLVGLITPARNLPFVKPNLPIVVTGNYRRNIISSIGIDFEGMKIAGELLNGALTLRTDTLNFDAFLDKDWFDNFEDNQYLFNDPTLVPFNFGRNISVIAKNVILNGARYNDFIYSVAGDSQRMSVSDSREGSLLVSITKSGMNYRYLIQLRRFFIPGKLMSAASAINIEGATVTAEAALETFGLTAYDIRQNMNGIVDASIDGGMIHGLGTDEFYDNAARVGRQDAEDAVRRALSGGVTRIRELEITGEYTGGDFRTTRPFMLTARHVDMTGNFWIRNNQLSARANIFLRGTSPVPRPVRLDINGGNRSFSMSEIMRGIDLEYLREFIRTHNRF